MFEIIKDLKMKKAFPLLLLMTVTAGLACQPGTGPDKAQGPTAPSVPLEKKVQLQTPPTVAIDRLHDDWMAFMSGLPGTDGSYRKREDAAAWREFVKSVDGHWAAFQAAFLEPMKAWAGQELRESGLVTKTLFYPFGGPDFVTSFALYPEAGKTVLMGLEPVGNLPEFEKNTAEWTDQYFKDSETILSDFLKRGYFVTEHMNEAFAKGRVDGALPVVAFFLKRTGHSVVRMARLAVNDKGEWMETPYAHLSRLPRRPSGIRIDYVRTGGSRVQSVFYFSCDLADPAFTKDSALFRLFDALEGVTTFIKSGSYLLHYGDFSNIRNMILGKSQYVLEDDTGIPYRYFKRQSWEIQLYGAYAKPIEDFPAIVEQKDLQAAYEDPASHVRKLPFHFGYRWVSKIDNLLLMKRPPAKTGTS